MSDRQLHHVIALADAGDIRAIGDLCRRYHTGKGGPRDDAAALLRCTQGAEKNLRAAQVWLGDIYMKGTGVPRDDALARTWYLKAADAGQAQAKFSLYEIHEKGLGVVADRALAKRYLREAADGGDLAAIDLILGIDPAWKPPVPATSEGDAVQYRAADDSLRFWSLPGSFTSAYYRLDQAPGKTTTLAIQEFKSDSRWAPMASMCFTGEGPSLFICFKLARASLDGAAIHAIVSTLSADQKVLMDETVIERTFVTGEAAVLEFAIEDAVLRINVDGKPVSMRNLDFKPELIRLGCSTAVCDFRLQ